MPIVVSNISLPFALPPEEAVAAAWKRLGDLSEIGAGAEARIVRRAVDARKRKGISFVYSVEAALGGGLASEERLVERLGDAQIRLRQPSHYDPPTGTEPLEQRPVIAGFGPAGMFAGLLLARRGYCPLILERGGPVEERVKAVESFWATGNLDPECNVQFGEGGAGTFSDGKLTTRIGDPRCSYILEELVKHGAPAEILTDAKPHIGTDLLRQVVKAIRLEIEDLGGEIRFHTPLEEIILEKGRVVRARAGGEELPVQILLLAPGHSARDTFAMLERQGIPLESKPFSVGARIEHLQSAIDRALYGEQAGHPLLPPGEYQLSHREKGREGDRAVYTFCMCPGGVVVPAASERGMVVTNGMSRHARDGKNANSALVVSVDSRDFGEGPLAGLRFQQKLERAAFEAGGGGYKAPFQRVGDFLGQGKPSLRDLVEPSYARGVTEAPLNQILPPQVAEMMGTGLRLFEGKLRGFGNSGAALTGVESRTSSPVRIPRGEDMASIGAAGLYPCGEGAGYAGGIVSAAVDGLRAAEAVLSRHRPME